MPLSSVKTKWVGGDLHYMGTGKVVFDDNVHLSFGTGEDTDIYFDGTSLIVSGAAFKPLQGIADPGNAGAIPVLISGYCGIVTAGAETRTLAAPTFTGQELLIYAKTLVGNAVITCATAVDETGNNTITLSAAGQALRIIAVEDGANLRWRCPVADPAAILSIV